MPTDKSANPYKSFLMSLNELSISHPIGCPYQCWAVLTFLVRTFKVFSLVFRMRTSGFPQNLITLNDNLPAGSLPSEDQLFENLKGYHLKAEGDKLLGY
jgi:hypothetical protein